VEELSLILTFKFLMHTLWSVVTLVVIILTKYVQFKTHIENLSNFIFMKKISNFVRLTREPQIGLLLQQENTLFNNKKL
jgi:hypothetical protein